MATTNGTLTPPSLPIASTSPSLGKRKFDAENAASTSNGASTSTNGILVNGDTRSLQPVLNDILSILKSYDTNPSILDVPIPSSSARGGSRDSESKRAKLTPPNGASTITNAVQNGLYDSLEDLETDVDTASAQILSSIDSKMLSAVPPSLEETRLQTGVLALQRLTKTLVSREQARLSSTPGKAVGSTEKEETNGVEQPVQVKEELSESRTVLTLFGSAQGPKQLFSSLQQPVRVPPTKSTTNSSLDTSIEVTLPLRESTLPNIISTTEVFPLQPELSDKKKVKTFGEVFRPPPSLPQLSPPKLAKPLTTRGNTITFVPQDPFPKPSRRSSHTYANQNLSTGTWLGYGGVDKPKDPTSPTAKQKSRQRALSTGEAQLPPSEATRAAAQQAKEDALFRSVYSSFAPSRDNASAIVPEETKNKVWWQKVGEKRFNDIFPIDPALLGVNTPSGVMVEDVGDEEESFKEAVENFTPAEPGPFPTSEKSELDKNTEEILQEISELLETLASHQRIRNSSLATNPRTPVIQNSSLASLAGSPSNPSSEEIDVYQMLKTSLTLMIDQLPPYAVARLNGDQLEELNISRTMIIETEDSKGVLEDDQLTRLAKAPAGVPAPSLSRMASAGSAAHSQYPASSSQFSRSTPSVHASVARPIQNAQSYFPQQQSVHRSPSVHYQRPSSGANAAYQTPAAPYGGNGISRSSYAATPSYSQQTPRPAYNQATPGQYYSQRPAPSSSYSGVTGSQYYQSTPQTQAHNRYAPQPSQNSFYQRPQNAGSYNYSAAPSPIAHSGSPLKANPAMAQPHYQSSRPAYGTSVSSSQTRSSSFYAQGVPQTPQYAMPQPPISSAGAPNGYGTTGTSHQQMMIDRQQAQLAAQPQARIAAQNSFNRTGSGTPQPPTQQNGGQQVNGAPMMT